MDRQMRTYLVTIFVIDIVAAGAEMFLVSYLEQCGGIASVLNRAAFALQKNNGRNYWCILSTKTLSSDTSQSRSYSSKIAFKKKIILVVSKDAVSTRDILSDKYPVDVKIFTETEPIDRNYKSQLLLYQMWNTVKINSIEYRLLSGVKNASIVFNNTGSTFDDWFTSVNVMQSFPWNKSDLRNSRFTFRTDQALMKIGEGCDTLLTVVADNECSLVNKMRFYHSRDSPNGGVDADKLVILADIDPSFQIYSI